MKVMSIFGTRPEIIRLSRMFPLLDENFDHVMVNTNQNYTKELNSIFFDQLKIRKPDYDLKIKTEAYGKEVAEIIIKSEDLLKKEQPDILLILGDTNSGLAAIPASHQGIKIAHLEAGMRSYDSRMPEEKNRKLSGVITLKANNYLDQVMASNTVNFKDLPYMEQQILEKNLNVMTSVDYCSYDIASIR